MVLLLNPRAGRRRPADLEGFEVVTPDGPEAMLRAAREHARPGEILVVGGGDGTLHTVLPAFDESGAILGILPCGTGNDVARHFGLTDPRTALKAGQVADVDLVRWQCGSREGWLINVAGTGFDAQVAAEVNRKSGPLGGTAAYVLAVLRCLARHQACELEVDLDGTRFEGPALLVAVANCSSYGGGMRIAPQASVRDGILDVVRIAAVSRATFLRAFPRVFSGRHLGHPAVEVWRARQVTLRTDPAMPFMVDGEVVGEGPARMEVVPGALRVVVPPAKGAGGIIDI